MKFNEFKEELSILVKDEHFEQCRDDYLKMLQSIEDEAHLFNDESNMKMIFDFTDDMICGGLEKLNLMQQELMRLGAIRNVLAYVNFAPSVHRQMKKVAELLAIQMVLEDIRGEK